MGNDGEMSGEVRRGHDITRLKKIGMKGEQGVRDPAGVGVVHGKVALDRWCISFEYICMQVTVRLGVIPSASRLHAPFFFCNCSICYSTKGDL